MEPDLRRALRLDVIGALIDDAKAHVFQHRHPLGQRNRPALAEDFQPRAGQPGAALAVEVDAERPLRREQLDHAHIADGDRRRIDLAIIDREGAAVARRQRVRLARVVGGGERLVQAVDPAAHDRFDRAVERGVIGIRRFALGAADDEVHAHQRAFRKERIEGTHLAIERRCEIIADQRPDPAVVALARNVNEDRDKAVEAVAPRQHAHARTLAELKDGKRELIEQVFVDLEQFVARIGLQHIDQRLAGMARRLEAGTADDVVGLAPQIGNGAHRPRIGSRGEQPADAVFADQLAVPVETLDADIIHVDAAMHRRAQGRLGDDKEPRLLHERANFRRDDERLVPALQRPHIARAQQPKPGLEHRFEHVGIAGEDVIARAEQREIVRRKPFQKLHRFGNFAGVERRRMGAQFGDDGAQPLQHRPPILHGDANLGENVFERAHDLGAPRRLRDAFDVDVDEAFVPAAILRSAVERRQRSRRVALHGEHRMDQKANVETALIELADDRIEQKRHVVIDDVEHRHGARHRRRFEADLGRAGLAYREQRPRPLGDVGKLIGRVALQIVGHRGAEQIGQERAGDIASALCQGGAGGGDERLAGVVIGRVGKILDVHAPVPAGQRGPLR